MTATAEILPPPAAKTPWRLVMLLGALTAFAPMSIDMYLPSLPALQTDLGATPGEAQASMASFFAGMAIGQFIYGPASDRFGRRPMILIGIGIYLIATVGCALATTPAILIAARFAQALGGCAGAVVARAVVRDRFGQQDTARILSLLLLIMGLAPLLAPSLGGLVLQVAGWRAIFGILVVFALSVGTWAFFGLAESRSEETAAQARSEHVFRALATLLQNRRLVGYAMAGALNGAMLFTYISGSADLIMGTYKISPVHFGWVFAVNAAALIGAAQVNRTLLRRWTSDRILSRACLVALACAAVFAFFAFTGIGGMWSVLPSVFFVLGSYGFMQGNTMAGALSVDPRRAGSISALMGGASFGAGAIVSTIAGLFHDGTARPMAVAVFVALLGSCLSVYLLTFRAPAGRS